MNLATLPQVAKYWTAAKRAGLEQNQVERFTTAGYVALPVMMPFHRAARLADHRGNGIRELLLDGTRGSAKSHAAIAQVGLDDCQRRDGLKILFLRQTERAAGESFQDLVSRVLRGIKHEANSERVTFPNGSRILIGGYKNEGDIDKYVGIEYDGLVLEEATQISGTKYEMLLGSVRTSREDWVPRTYLTTNPGGVGHQYFKKRFIDPHRARAEQHTRRFYSSYKDNPFINPEYREYLESLTGDLAKAWRDGDWDIYAGMAFPSWNHARHVIRPFEIPAHWIRMTGTDWGNAKPWCNLWAAKNPDNSRIVVYREAYSAGLTDPRQAETIKSMEPPGERIAIRYADPSMWAKDTRQAVPTSSYDVYMSKGLILQKANNDRLAGKRKVDALLEDMPDGKPGLLIFETCPNLIRTLPDLQHSKLQPEDVDTEGEDHAYDALRYQLTDYIKRDTPPRPKPVNEWDNLKRM
jgi:phage terminase large subunit